MALFELSVLSFAITTISPKVVLEQKLVLLKYTSDISDVIFHAEVKKQTGFSVPTTEQGLNACDIQGVTIRELTEALCSLMKPVDVLHNTSAVQIPLGTVLWVSPADQRKWLIKLGGHYHKLQSQSNETVFLVGKQSREPPHKYFQ